MAGLFDRFPYLTSNPITLRQISENDLDAIYAIYSNPEHFRHSPDVSSRHKETILKRIDHFNRDFQKKKRLFLGLEKDREIVGILECFDYKKRLSQVTIGYRIHHTFWGQGLATKGLTLLTGYLHNDCQIKTIKAYVMVENIASKTVLEKNNFYVIGSEHQNWKGHGEVDLLVFEKHYQ